MRVRERQQAYINFFSKLLTEIREETNLPVREVSPGGSSWIGCCALASGGVNVGQFGFSFIRSNGFRVELYIDSGNQESNKQIFDLIYAKRSDFEEDLGEISWERIDNKRASRIALYQPGTITDSDEELDTLIKWAVSKMNIFFPTLNPIATQAADQVLSK